MPRIISTAFEKHAVSVLVTLFGGVLLWFITTMLNNNTSLAELGVKVTALSEQINEIGRRTPTTERLAVFEVRLSTIERIVGDHIYNTTNKIKE